MKILNIINHRINLWRHQKYILKTLAYHEAGHLVFAYLLNIHCKSIQIYYRPKNSFHLNNHILNVEFESKSFVDCCYPIQMMNIIYYNRFNINAISTLNKIPENECWDIVKQYLFILLAGNESQKKFERLFYNRKIDDYGKFAQNLTKLDPNEDINKMIKLMNDLTPDNNFTNKIVQEVLKHIRYLLQQKEVEEAINNIAKKVLRKEIVEWSKIKNIFDRTKFSNYCESERTAIIDRLKNK